MLKQNVQTERDELPMSVEIAFGNQLGLGLEPNTLLFGRIGPGYSVYQEFTMKNDESDKVVDIYVEGSMVNWTYISDSHFTIKKGENKRIKVRCSPDEYAKEGKYNSTMVVISRTI